MNWLEKATLKFLEIVKGPNHPSVAVCLEKIGKFYFEMGNLEEAEPHFERALKIIEKKLWGQIFKRSDRLKCLDRSVFPPRRVFESPRE
ncbi:MAG: tetratricopeptide repeat protein [Nitrospira sp.]|nr:tetratricopeptide repeat protein [Nitrospira sp.]